MSLINYNQLDKEAQIYKNDRTQMDNSIDTINNTIESNTKEEVKAVQNAIKNLNQKVELLLQSEKLKIEQNILEQSQEQIRSSIKVATDIFFKVRNVIRQKNLSKEHLREYERQLYKKIIEKFLTKDEIAEFERLISIGPIITIGHHNEQISNTHMKQINY